MKKDIIDRAKEILEKNWRGTYTCPAIPKYPHQWLWDSCFCAIVWSKIDPSKARQELESLLAAQNEEGFLPCLISDGKMPIWSKLLMSPVFSGRSTRYTQPPVLAMALEEVYRSTGDKSFVKVMLPKVRKFYDWLELNRDVDDDHLLAVIHPFEIADHSPVFDQLFGITNLKPTRDLLKIKYFQELLFILMARWDSRTILKRNIFNVEDVMFNCIYVEGLRSLARLATVVGDKEFEEESRVRADRTQQSLLEKCWNEEQKLFFSLRHVDGKHEQLKVVTLASLSPIILDNLPKSYVDLLVAHLDNENEFWTNFPIPFVSLQEKTFDPEDNGVLWRGPSWVNTNWLVIRGLRKNGQRRLASELARKTVEMVAKNGFWEFYHPFLGKGEGQRDYSWSTLVVDILDYY